MWPESTIYLLLSVLTMTAVLCGIAEFFGRITRQRWPAVAHAFWVVVLLRLAIPPFVPLVTPGFPQVSDVETSPSQMIPHDVVSTQPVTSTKAVLPKIDSKLFEEAQRFPDTGASTNIDVGNENVLTQNAELTKISGHEGNVIATSGSPVETHSPPVRPTSEIQPRGSSEQASWILNMETPTVTTAWMICFIWATGSLVVLLKALWSIWSFTRLLNLSEPISPHLRSAANNIASRVGLRKTPTVIMLAATIPPLVWSGFGRILVVLPRDLTVMDEPKIRDLLLAHEFAHIRRRDYLTRWLELAVNVLWWWCPLFWIARSRLRSAEETACDAQVLSIWPNLADEYSKAIVETVAFVAKTFRQPQLTTGGLGPVRQLESRLKLIQDTRSTAQTGMISICIIILLATITCPLLLVGKTIDANVMPNKLPKSVVLVEAESSIKKSNVKQGKKAEKIVRATETKSTRQIGPSLREDREEAKAALPPTCQPVYAVRSPDKTWIAFNGRYTGKNGVKKYGLFSYHTATKATTCLIEKALKTAPAWSPDSKMLAIGNSPGYGNTYPLVVVNLESGNIDKTGVQGAGAAWSPDGRYIAVSTNFGIAGSPSQESPRNQRYTFCPPGATFSDRCLQAEDRNQLDTLFPSKNINTRKAVVYTGYGLLDFTHENR